jgi:TPR repeat protein
MTALRSWAAVAAVTLGGLGLGTACNSKKMPDLVPLGGNAGDPGDQPAPNPSGGIVVNAIMACDDIPTCDRECDAGASDRCRRLAVSYFSGQNVEQDETHATALFVKACDMGNASACLSVGQMYEYHHGVPKDDARAVKAYRASCDLGWAAGCVNYGIMLENGRGVPQDLAAARALYESGCKQGGKQACAYRDALDARSAADGGSAP